VRNILTTAMTVTEPNETDGSARSSSLDISDQEMRDLSAQFVTLEVVQRAAWQIDGKDDGR
jgi:hypothetical protein